MDRNLISLYFYYRATGDPNYLRVVNALVDEHRRWPGTVNITSQINPTMGLPAALGVLAEADGPIAAFPVVRQYGNSPQVSVYAPEGFRMQGARATDYFRVTADVQTLRILLGVPTEVRRPDGSVALEADAGKIGERQIPAAGHAGVWRLNATQSGIVRLLNVEPLFSRSPQWLVKGAHVAPAPRFEPPSADVAFVPGRRGRQTLHMPGSARLRFPRGEKVAHGYANFPGNEGTVEFWFRPNWSSGDLAYAMGSRFNDRYFLRAGSHDLQYRRGKARATEPEFASLNLWAYGQESNAGFTGRFWFKAGQWYHLAFTWRTTDGAPGDDGDYAVYVNGNRVAADDFGRGGVLHYWPGRVTGGDLFHRREADQHITIGPLDGTIEQLRISDTIRYQAPFQPPETLSDPDSHTRVQFPLDGDRQGETADSTKLSLEP